jgi:transcriptional regulator with XRE-family HTH domain
MIKKNVKLRAAFFESGKSMTEVAKETGISRPYLSMACNGRLVLTDEEKFLIAKSLNRPVEELFAVNV